MILLQLLLMFALAKSFQITDQDLVSKSSALIEELEDINLSREAVSDTVSSSESSEDHLKNYRLKGIRDIITPELLMNLAAAGSGDTIFLAASDYPIEKIAADSHRPLIRIPGHPIPHLIEEIMKLIKVSLCLLLTSLLKSVFLI